MVTLCRFGFNHRLGAQHLLFGSADAGIADHPAPKQQIAGRRANPAVDSDGRITLAGPRNHPAHPLELLMNVLHRLNRRGEQLPERIGDELRTRLLHQPGLTRLGNQGQRQGINHLQTAVGACPARRLHVEVGTHPIQSISTPHQRAPGLIHLIAVAILHAELHQLVLRQQQAIELAVDLLLHRARREEQIGHDSADDPDDDLAAALNGKLRGQQRFGLHGNDDDQRGVARQAPRVGVFNPHQRGDPGAEARPETANHQHHQRGADHADDHHQRGNAADKGPDNTQHAPVADRPRVGFPPGGKGRTGGHNRCRQHRPARRFQIKVKANKQRQHNGAGQFDGKAHVLVGDGEDTHRG